MARRKNRFQQLEIPASKQAPEAATPSAPAPVSQSEPSQPFMDPAPGTGPAPAASQPRNTGQVVPLPVGPARVRPKTEERLAHPEMQVAPPTPEELKRTASTLDRQYQMRSIEEKLEAAQERMRSAQIKIVLGTAGVIVGLLILQQQLRATPHAQITGSQLLGGVIAMVLMMMYRRMR